ncbi:MAG: ABC transporter ATP-binding protein [Mycoplasmataceae bacterium]|nr:ABC transporter ATP-binding protein [Mycoplasmataceae bacterium]
MNNNIKKNKDTLIDVDVNKVEITEFKDSHLSEINFKKSEEALSFLRENNILSQFEYNQKLSLLKRKNNNIHVKSKYNPEDHKILISVENLTKHYSKRKNPAVDNISFNIREGEFHAFIGANGAGKTTTIKAIVGAYSRYQGKILIDGQRNDTVKAKRRIGYVPESAIFPKEFTTRDYLESMSIMSGLSSADAKKFTTQKLEELNMLELQHKKPVSFSSGQKKKILLAQAMVHNPDILIMDEPAANLDPFARSELFAILEKYRKDGKSIFISSHILSEVDKYADTATILDGGKIVFHSKLDGNENLEELYSKYVILGSVDTNSEAKS